MKMNEFEHMRRMVKKAREIYPPGTRIKLLCMNDPYHPVPSGTRGTVESMDDAGTFHMKWDNGRSLGVVYGEDDFRALTAKELEEEQLSSEQKIKNTCMEMGQ